MISFQSCWKPNMVLINRKDLIDLFHENGYKVTPQRLAIFECIMGRRDHPSASEIHSELKREYPTISQATIYNTLHILRDIGAIQELGFEDGKTRFDPDTSIHVNLVCTACGKITDFTDEDLVKAWIGMVEKTAKKTVGQRLDLYYKCTHCSRMVSE
ncbi:transcriptional repressor [Candidatus Bathyarchaeota archaeon]|nr:transcriptional repressor [Candidatus Bathyarchaeota archaeon]